MKALGPGHWLDTEVLAQSALQRQLPVPEEQEGFVQHFMLEASEGQAFEIEVPPEEVQSDVEMQTPVLGCQ